jgi:hypothetical protein
MKKLFLSMLFVLGLFPLINSGTIKFSTFTAVASDEWGEEEEDEDEDDDDWDWSQPSQPSCSNCLDTVYVVGYRNTSYPPSDNADFFSSMYSGIGFPTSGDDNDWTGSPTDASNGLQDGWSFEQSQNTYGETEYYYTPPTPEEFEYPDPNYVPVPIYVAPIDYSQEFIRWIAMHMKQVANIDQNAIFRTQSTTPRLLTFKWYNEAVRAYVEIKNGPVDMTFIPLVGYPNIILEANLEGDNEEYILDFRQPGNTGSAIKIKTYSYHEYDILIALIWMLPWGPMPAPPEATNSNNEVLQFPASLNGHRTYLSPSGVPFMLPADAKVGALKMDYTDFPDGAIYSFYLKNGNEYDHYIIDASFYVRKSGNAIDPSFTTYYKVVNGKIDRTQPYIPEYPVVPPGTTNMQVVRLRHEVTPTGCRVVQELVDYDTEYTGVGGRLPTDPSHWDSGVQTTIEFSPVVAGSTSNSHDVPCPPAAAGNSNTLKEIMEYATNPKTGAESLRTSLGPRIKNSFKIYLYDCATGNVKATVTKEAMTPISEANQAAENATFNDEFNGNFSNNSQDIIVKGCLENGKWKYDIKYNPNSLHPTPKMAASLQDVQNEIKRQADEEVAKHKLGAVNFKSQGQYLIKDNELFRKDPMSLLESVTAIYDCGKTMINTGAMPESIWDHGMRANGVVDQTVKEANTNSFFEIPAIPAGGVDEVVNQATGAVQLVKTGLEVIRHPIKTAQSLWDGVKSLNVEKLGQIVSSATGADNILAGGDRAKYQGGHYAVMAATIFISPLKVPGEGSLLVKKAGNEMTAIQKFVPDGLDNPAVGNALKNAADNGFLAKAIDEEKMIAKNLVNGEERFISIDKAGDIYESRALNNMDEIGDDVMKAADAGDLAEGANSAAIHTEMKTQPQRFKDGKAFEKNITNDPAHTGRVQTASGIDLSTYTKGEQVQIQMADGSWMVADNIYYKPVPGSSTDFDIVINETKISSAAPMSENQLKLLQQLSNGITNFELRTSKFTKSAVPMPKGARVNVQSFVKTEGVGVTDISNYNLSKLY